MHRRFFPQKEGGSLSKCIVETTFDVQHGVVHQNTYICTSKYIENYNICTWKNGFSKVKIQSLSIMRSPQLKTSGVHYLLYFAYTCVQDLFIGGAIYLAEKDYKVFKIKV